MQDILEKIIAAGSQAPSGENCQPWKFEVADNKIHIINLPERDNSLYSWGQRSSYVAHGALLLNMEVMAKSLGYNLNAILFPNDNKPNHIASVSISPSVPENHELAQQIYKRTTNRKAYKNYEMIEQIREDLHRSADELKTKAAFILVEDKDLISQLGNIAAINERVLFENKDLHHFFFNHINWNLKEDQEKSIGFYIKTLELPTPIQLGFKLFKHWQIENILNKIGFPKIIALGNGKLYGTASGFGAIVIDDISPKNYIEAGKLLQLIWLKLTKHDLYMQPLTGLIFLMLRIGAKETRQLSEMHQAIIKKSNEKIKILFNTDKIVAMMFRIGIADQPSAKSSRLKPKIA